MTEKDLPAVLIMGPTASGKTGLSLALATRFDCEIISVDSAQVYRGMDIGTAKPDAATLAQVPHHLVDILDPADSYSAARFADDATRLAGEIRARGRLPLLVGGTFLYYRALLQGLSDLPSADPATRAVLEAEARDIGWPAMHTRLAEVDVITAARLHPNDSQRIQRALEIFRLTGRPLSAWHAESAGVGRLAPPWVKLAMNPPSRDQLHARIERRFIEMMDTGLVEEVAALRARGDLHPELPSIRSVGYRQVWGYLAGEYGREEAVQRGIAATRQFAKRQLTWLRNETDALFLDPDDPLLLERALAALGA